MIHWKIPTSFTSINRTYVVEEIDDTSQTVLAAMDIHSNGLHLPDEAKIFLDLASENQDLIEHSFLHEWVHSALEASGYEHLSKDEEFVDEFSAMLHQFLQTAEGDVQLEDESII